MANHSSASSSVKAWLEKTGLPLEMETEAAFRAVGFDTEHSSVYSDPESDKGREMDVVAHTRDSFGAIHVYGVVECKSSPNPWVVLTNDRFRGRLWYASLGLLAEHTQEVVPRTWLRSSSEIGNRLQWISSGGYALRQAFGKESDPAYAASIAVTKAARSFVYNPAHTIKRHIFAFPIIVVDAPIFECRLSGSGELQLNEVRSSSFSFTAYIPERLHTMIRVISRSALRDHALPFYKLARAMIADMEPAGNAVLEQLRRGKA